MLTNKLAVQPTERQPNNHPERTRLCEQQTSRVRWTKTTKIINKQTNEEILNDSID